MRGGRSHCPPAGRAGWTAPREALRDCGVLIDFRGLSEDTIPTVEVALAPLGLTSFDPQRYNGTEVDPLYAMSYEEESNDPDPGYWVEVEFDAAALQRCQVEGYKAIGAQSANGVDYVYFEIANMDDASEITAAINQGRTFCPPNSLTYHSIDERAKYCVVVCVPPQVVQQIAYGKPAQLQVTAFTAFANDDEVFEYQHWGPGDHGECTGLFSLLSMPQRVKTILSAKFAFQG